MYLYVSKPSQRKQTPNCQHDQIQNNGSQKASRQHGQQPPKAKRWESQINAGGCERRHKQKAKVEQDEQTPFQTDLHRIL